MTFLFPLGFLALLAIPVLILIYIIKNRYTEQTVSSTYLWTLSERFLRRRIPINRLTGLLSLILQILAVCLIALIVAHPILSVPGGANQYCFILDGSGSMNMEQGGSTRFEEAKKKIADIIDDSMNGSTYTLIYAGETTATWLENNTSKDITLEVLEDLEVSHVESDFSSALNIAQRYYNENRSALTYLVTDKTYTGDTQNVTVINVLNGTANYGVADVEYVLTGTGSITVSGNVTASGGSAPLTVEVYFAGSELNEENDGSYVLYDTLTVNAVDGAEVPFEIECAVTDFSSVKVRIVETDSLALDNEAIVYNVLHENISSTLIINGASADNQYHLPVFLLAALEAAGNTEYEIIRDTAYNSNRTGYGLYIFNNYTPEEVPRDGVVWFINPQRTVQGSRFSFFDERYADPSIPATYNKNSNTRIQQMLEGLSQQDFELDKYVRLSIPSTFTKYIECDGNPLLFSGDNEYDNRQVVFAFDLAASATFTLSSDFTTLVSRLLSFSFPEIVESTSFYCGDTLQVNRISGCIGMRIDKPLGKSEYPDVSTSYTELTLTEVGVYTVHLTMKDGSEREISVYASLPKAERVLASEDTTFALIGDPGGERLAGIIDNLLVIFIILAVIAVADYGVYCYEQYQLR